MEIALYSVTHKETGRMYIGITSMSLRKRWNAHNRAARAGRKTHICNAIRLYGKNAFDVKLMAILPDREYAATVERAAIQKYNTLSPAGFNLSTGGEKNIGFSFVQSVREKQRQGRLGKSHTDEAKKLISEARRGIPISDAAKKTRQTDEYRAKMSEANKKSLEKRRQIMMTDEYKEKQRQAQIARYASRRAS